MNLKYIFLRMCFDDEWRTKRRQRRKMWMRRSRRELSIMFFFVCVCVVSFIENFKWNNWNAYDKIIDSVKNTLRYLANIHILVEHGKGYGMVAHYPSTSGVYFKLVKR